jgi:hypothetical protein
MEHQYYFPKTYPEIRKWLVNYKARIAENGAALGMSPDDITHEQNFCDAMILAIDTADFAKSEAKKRQEEKVASIKENTNVLFPLITTHKANTGYTEGIGKDLGVIGTEISFDPSTVKTNVNLKKTPLGIEISFNLNHCESGNIYCKRAQETDFTFLKRVTHPHTIDTRENANGADSEVRNYYVFLLLNDEEVGQRSDIASITN